MNTADMNLQSTSKGAEANGETITDDETQKVVRVSPKGRALKIGDEFDVTLHFEWQASDVERNDFDGFNLMNMRYPVGKLEYHVTYPWQAARIDVREYVLEHCSAECEIDLQYDGSKSKLTIVFPRPKPVVYLIFFSQRLRRWLEFSP